MLRKYKVTSKELRRRQPQNVNGVIRGTDEPARLIVRVMQCVEAMTFTLERKDFTSTRTKVDMSSNNVLTRHQIEQLIKRTDPIVFRKELRFYETRHERC
jgi:hypothetical protein